MPKKKKPPTPWEIARPILEELHLDGTIANSVSVSKDVWPMRPEFMAVKHNNFYNNFRRMKNTVTANKQRAVIDEAGFLHDIAIHPLARDTAGCWDGSDAQRLLKEDMDDRKQHEKMKPKMFYLSRPEYQHFPLEKFRGHIHQELRATRETNCWTVKKKKKQLAKEAKTLRKTVNEEDVDFLCDPVLDVQLDKSIQTIRTDILSSSSSLFHFRRTHPKERQIASPLKCETVVTHCRNQ